MTGCRVTVVVVTRDRCHELLSTLGRLAGLPERPRVVVVDNGSGDGTVQAVRAAHPSVRVVPAGGNLGAAGRNLGVARAATPYVAFSDDDSWWAPGALSRAEALLDRHPRLGLVAARMLVGPDERLDPVSRAMAASPLPHREDLPGPPVLGFVACGAVVRGRAFLAEGGFQQRFGVGGEETLLALDLSSSGWGLAYVDDVVAHHHPSIRRQVAARRRRECRNALWTGWLRRPAAGAVRASLGLLSSRRWEWATWAGLLDALAATPAVARERRVVPTDVEHGVRLLEGAWPPT